MDSRPHYEIVHGDPLSPVTRLERRNLVMTSGFVFLMTQGGLIPTRIDALGLTFDAVDRRGLLLAFSIILGYQLAAFVVYAGNDWYLSTYAGASRSRGLLKLHQTELAGIEAALDRAISNRDRVSNSEQLAKQLLETQRSIAARLADLRIEMTRMEIEGAVVDFANWRDWPRLGTVGIRVVFDFFAPLVIGLAALVAVIRAM